MNTESRLIIEYIMDSESSTCTTFILHFEDYTLGNALRDVIIKLSKVEFCGYSIPHPSDNIINLRIQSSNESTEMIFYSGLKNLKDISQLIFSLFELNLCHYKL